MASEQTLWEMSIDMIATANLDGYLTRVNPQFEDSWVKNSWVFRERAAQPIIPLHYSSMIPDHRTPMKNLYLANTTQIYPEDRGTNYSVRLGNDIARLVLEDLDKTPLHT